MSGNKRFKLMGILFAGAALTATAGVVGTKEISRLRSGSLHTATLGYNTSGYNPIYVPPTTGYVPPAPIYVPPVSGYVPPAPGYVPPTAGYVPPVRPVVPPYKAPGYVPPSVGYIPPARPAYVSPNATSGYVPPAAATRPTSSSAPRPTAVTQPKLEKIPAPWRIRYYTNIRRIGNSLYGVLKK